MKVPQMGKWKIMRIKDNKVIITAQYKQIIHLFI